MNETPAPTQAAPTQAAPTQAAPSPAAPAQAAGNEAAGAQKTGVHVLATVCAVVVLCNAFGLLIGFVWFVFALRRTGFRARDAWLLLVPILNVVLVVRCVWRATSTTVTWSPRPDLRSEPLAMWTSPARWFAELSGP